MPSSYTPNYQFNQWEADDRVLRTDFNADNAKLDGALAGLEKKKADVSAVEALTQTVAGKAEVVFGTYTGDGAADRVIELGFTPKAVYLCPRTGRTHDVTGGGANFEGGFFMQGFPLTRINTNPELIVAEIVEGGIHVRREVGPNYSYIISTNGSGSLYYYVAFR